MHQRGGGFTKAKGELLLSLLGIRGLLRLRARCPVALLEPPCAWSDLVSGTLDLLVAMASRMAVRFSVGHVREDEVPILPLGPVRHLEIACRLCPSLAKPLTGRLQFVKHRADLLLPDPGTARNQRILDHIVRGACYLRVA